MTQFTSGLAFYYFGYKIERKVNEIGYRVNDQMTTYITNDSVMKYIDTLLESKSIITKK